MSYYLNSMLIVIGIFLMMMFYHLILFINKNQQRLNISIVLLLFVSISYLLLEYIMLQTDNIEVYRKWHYLLVFNQPSIIIAFLWFAYTYAEYKNPKILIFLTAFWIVYPILRCFDEGFLFYESWEGLKKVILPWNEIHYHVDSDLSVFAYFYHLLILINFVYIFYIGIRKSSLSKRRRTFVFLAFFYFSFLLFDIAQRILNINFIRLVPYANLSFLFIVNYTMNRELVLSQKLQNFLQIQKEQLDLAISSTGAGLWDWYIQEDKVIFSELWARMVGYTLEELEPVSLNTWKELTHPDDLKKAMIKIQEHIDGKAGQYKAELRMKHKSGHWIWIIDTGKVVERDKNGAALRMTGTHIDISYLKEIEASLKHEQEMLQAINSNIPIGVALTAADGSVLHTNKALHDIIGYATNEIDPLNKWFTLAYPDEEYRKMVIARWTKANAKGYANVHFKVRCKNGTDKEIEFKSIILPDSRSLVTFEDITEKLKKDKEIRETKTLLDTALEEAPVGIIIADAPGVKIRVANKAALLMNGEYPEKLINIDLSEHARNWKTYKPDGKTLFDPLDLPLSRAILKGEYVRNEIVVIRGLDGTDHWSQANAAPIYNEHREIIAGIVIFNDITKQVEAERNLSKTKNYIDNILNSMPSTIIGIDNQLKITHWNRNAEKRTSITFSNTREMRIIDILPELDNVAEKIIDSIRKKRIFTINKKHSLIDNREIIEDITIYPLISNGVEGAVIRIDDITEKVNMEEMMIQSEKMLSVGGLAAGMAHEINNPLAGMMQNATVLINRLTRDSVKNREVAEEVGLDLNKLREFMEKRSIIKQLDLILSSGKRASELVTNMLSFARKSESKFKLSNLEKLLNNTLDLVSNDYDLKKHYDFRKIQIIREYPNEEIKILCEETKLQQVFLNILKNGAESMVVNGKQIENPRFILRIMDMTSIIRLEIENNGPVIPREIRTRIFEPFFTTKGIGKGTGLGLSVSYFIISENHKGSMWVESDPSFGTKFIIELPRNL
ncbi:MAG: PAS domain S-box protein [Candidatus Marinimicrobia bacterium]|nr:PAS domain S-box protein [Candidatus Neomarinimicrobiota bacterium]